MALRECKVCNSLYDDKSKIRSEKNAVCPNCRMKLEGTYNRIHNYIRDHEDQITTDITDIKKLAHRLAADTDTDIEELQLLFELGWFERDIQTYGLAVSARQILAGEFSDELGKMIERKKAHYTYSGRYYSRRRRRY